MCVYPCLALNPPDRVCRDLSREAVVAYFPVIINLISAIESSESVYLCLRECSTEQALQPPPFPTPRGRGGGHPFTSVSRSPIDISSRSMAPQTKCWSLSVTVTADFCDQTPASSREKPRQKKKKKTHPAHGGRAPVTNETLICGRGASEFRQSYLEGREVALVIGTARHDGRVQSSSLKRCRYRLVMTWRRGGSGIYQLREVRRKFSLSEVEVEPTAPPPGGARTSAATFTSQFSISVLALQLLQQFQDNKMRTLRKTPDLAANICKTSVNSI